MFRADNHVYSYGGFAAKAKIWLFDSFGDKNSAWQLTAASWVVCTERRLLQQLITSLSLF